MDVESLTQKIANVLRPLFQFREEENRELKNKLADLKRENAQLRKQVNKTKKKVTKPAAGENHMDMLEEHFAFDNGATPLLQYCLLNQADKYARRMIEAGSEINARSAKFATALHITALRNLKALSQLLIEKGVDVNPSDSKGQKPLHYAAQRNSIGAAKALIEADAWIDARDKDRNTPLHIACQYGSYEVAKFLVEEGSDTSALNTKDQEPYDCFLDSSEERCRTRFNIKMLMQNLFADDGFNGRGHASSYDPSYTDDSEQDTFYEHSEDDGDYGSYADEYYCE